jgi:hypothetical protein
LRLPTSSINSRMSQGERTTQAARRIEDKIVNELESVFA